MRVIDTVSELPAVPAVYAMYERTLQGETGDLIYIGITHELRGRITQHLVRRDSSITTGAAALSINPDRVGEVRWWEHEQFATPVGRGAAELIATFQLRPAYVSRGNPLRESRKLADDPLFRSTMIQIFTDVPTGRLRIPTLHDALQRIERLEEALAVLRARLEAVETAWRTKA